jgi:hypothetical protein
MSLHVLDMVLSGLVYVILVYFIMRMLRGRNTGLNGNDENDGGIAIHSLPELDLPPGITLPGIPPTTLIKETEEIGESEETLA